MRALLLLATLLVLIVDVTGLPKGFIPQLDYLCNFNVTYIGVPWDCTGYIQCVHNRAAWLNCARGLEYDMKRNQCVWKKGRCQNLDDIVTNECPNYPTILIPDPKNCARFYDCSEIDPKPPLTKYNKECPFPKLFNETILQCLPRDQVVCGTRETPKDKCSYLLECQENECTGKPDGNIPDPSGNSDAKYIVCANESVVSRETCDFIHGEVFNGVKKMCLTKEEDILRKFCPTFPVLVIPHPKYCARFYDCREIFPKPPLTKYNGECPYPQLFDAASLQCLPRDQVNCRTRERPKDQCSYVLECQENECTGKPDGNIPDPSETFGAKYIVCANENVVSRETCDISLGEVFDRVTKMCTAKEEDIVINVCPKNPTFLIPHPKNCARFYDCSEELPKPPLTKYNRECPFPQLFDVAALDCLPRDQVDCGTREIPKDKCSYVLECQENECTGKPDGNIPDPSGNFGAKYIVCANENVVSRETCDFIHGEVFNRATKMCSTKEEDFSRDFCPTIPAMVFPHPKNCARFYDCSEIFPKPPLTKYNGECPYPQLFDAASLQCLPHDQVNCGTRERPKDQCSYVLECQENECTGKPDGNIPDPSETFGAKYIVCANENVVSRETCDISLGEVFDRVTKMCTAKEEDIVINVCPKNPTILIPHSKNCARFYDCSEELPKPPLTKYNRECPFPQLFDVAALECLPRDQVDCDTREIPKDKCSYVLECQENECTGKPDGNIPDPSGNFGAKYIVCANENVVSREMCDFIHGEVFNRATKMCSTKEEDILRKFCPTIPVLVIPHPKYCARFYDCREIFPKPPLTKYNGECPYPQLFDAASLQCLPRDQVNCRTRERPKDQCSYVLECQENECTGKPDGNIPDPSETFGAKYIVCANENVVSRETCDISLGEVFDRVTKMCTAKEEDIVINVCPKNPTILIPHTKNCARFYNCSEELPKPPLTKYNRECPFPQLFDVAALECLPRDQVDCGTREIPKDKCSYVLECQENECTGKPDGNIPDPSGNFGAKYIVCANENVVSREMCDFIHGEVFNRATKMCSTKEEDISRDFCPTIPFMVFPHPKNCARFYDCSEIFPKPPLTKYNGECPYPQLFDAASLQCLPHDQVNCGTRERPKDQCSYVLECQKNECTGKPDGNIPDPSEVFGGKYIVCANENVVSRKTCDVSQEEVFDHVTKMCTDKEEDIVINVCPKFPTFLIPHPKNCARFYDCSEIFPKPPLTKYNRECPYPQLFDAASLQCLPHDQVNCGTREIPKDKCSYMLECQENECTGKPDGNIPDPSETFGAKYIVCANENVVSQETCDISLEEVFDRVTKMCTAKEEGLSNCSCQGEIQALKDQIEAINVSKATPKDDGEAIAEVQAQILSLNKTIQTVGTGADALQELVNNNEKRIRSSENKITEVITFIIDEMTDANDRLDNLTNLVDENTQLIPKSSDLEKCYALVDKVAQLEIQMRHLQCGDPLSFDDLSLLKSSVSDGHLTATYICKNNSEFFCGNNVAQCNNGTWEFDKDRTCVPRQEAVQNKVSDFTMPVGCPFGVGTKVVMLIDPTGTLYLDVEFRNEVPQTGLLFFRMDYHTAQVHCNPIDGVTPDFVEFYPVNSDVFEITVLFQSKMTQVLVNGTQTCELTNTVVPTNTANLNIKGAKPINIIKIDFDYGNKRDAAIPAPRSPA